MYSLFTDDHMFRVEKHKVRAQAQSVPVQTSSLCMK